ncbi:MAG TPA: DUF3240 family protein [Gammaproteobacteria bacterium]|nr:DUF3240 family protein [Gammaproteobacteria bacterium]
MSHPDTCLTLLFPKILEDRVIDMLVESEVLVRGFTLCEVDELGRAAEYQTALEKVLGRAHRMQVTIILDRAGADKVIKDLKQILPRASIVYYMTPVTEFGSFL